MGWVGWVVMGWDRMGWDGMGWAGLGWDGVEVRMDDGWIYRLYTLRNEPLKEAKLHKLQYR